MVLLVYIAGIVLTAINIVLLKLVGWIDAIKIVLLKLVGWIDHLITRLLRFTNNH